MREKLNLFDGYKVMAEVEKEHGNCTVVFYYHAKSTPIIEPLSKMLIHMFKNKDKPLIKPADQSKTEGGKYSRQSSSIQ